ncbi:MAG: hypothetical protein WCF85_18035 [Rhodospirillaceae bacterium]
MGLKKLFPEVCSARFRTGTTNAIESLLDTDESPAGFIRTAVAAEIHRRRRRQKRQDDQPRSVSEPAEIELTKVPAEAVDWHARAKSEKENR